MRNDFSTTLLCLLIFSGVILQAQHPSSIADFSSTDKGVLLPRMTMSQIENINSPATGLMAFNTEDNCLYIYDGTEWLAHCGYDYSLYKWMDGLANLPVSGFGETFELNGSGYIIREATNKMYKYNSFTDQWSARADVPWPYNIWGIITFSVRGKAYAGTGLNISNISYLDSIYCYNDTTDSWTPITVFPGGGRWEAVAFTIGDTVYVGGGENSAGVHNDFYKYDVTTNTWTQINDFPGPARKNASSFIVNGKGYVGTGQDGGFNQLKDMYEYDPSTGAWSQIADYGGNAMHDAIGFTLDNKGFMGAGVGDESSLYFYDPDSDTWLPINYPIDPSNHTWAFTIGKAAYIGNFVTMTDMHKLTIPVFFLSGGGQELSWISEIVDPTEDTDVANKRYVDNLSFWNVDAGALVNTNAGDMNIMNETIFVDSLTGNTGFGTATPNAPVSFLLNGGTNQVGITQQQMGGGATMEFLTEDAGGNMASRLVLRGAVDDADIEFYRGSRTNEALSMLVDGATGRVGIGTNAPSSLLEVNGAAPDLEISNTSENEAALEFNDHQDPNNQYARIAFNAASNDLLFYNESATATMTLDPTNGRVGIGLTNPSYQLELSTNSAAKPTSSAWTVSSDARLKKDVSSFNDGLDIIRRINPVWFTYNGKAGLPEGARGVGTVAQDLQRVAPYLVKTMERRTDDGHAEGSYLGADYGPLDFILVNAVKELAAQNELLRQEIDLLKEKVAALEERN